MTTLTPHFPNLIQEPVYNILVFNTIDLTTFTRFLHYTKKISHDVLSGLYSIRKTETDNYIIMRPTIFLPFNSTSQSRIEL